MSLTSELKALIETEMHAGGLLAGLNGVFTGGVKLIPTENYPALVIDSAPGKYHYNGNHLLVEHNYMLSLLVIEPDVSEAEDTRNALLYDPSVTPRTGLVAFFLQYGSITVDGIFYAFEEDPDLLFADVHEDGRFLYPGTGARHESGTGAALGTKLNLPLPPGAGDAEFLEAFAVIEAWLDRLKPEFILFQCGADSIAGDPITHLALTPAAHGHAAARLSVLAERHAGGRLIGFGGGGYNRRNLALGWTAVVRSLVDHGTRAANPVSAAF